MILKRWQTDTRYYEMQLVQDLLGDWCIQKYWGGRQRHNAKTLYVQNMEEGEKLIEKTHKIRLSHGYALS